MDSLPDALEKYVEAALEGYRYSIVPKERPRHWMARNEHSDAMRAAILAFLNAAEKDGWGMKPRKPTPEMIEAADHVLWDPVSQRYSVDVDAIADAYCAMFDAAKDEGP